MTADAPQPTTASHPQKLAIVHLLGWTLGVAVVLGIYRAAAAWHSRDGQPVQMTWPTLGYGLAYGTAVSGLGLFLWRWWRGASQGPTQPGHWLLVFGGMGLVLDVAIAAAAEGAVALAGPGPDRSYVAYLWHQSVGWAVAAGIGAVVLLNLRGAGRLWVLATLLVTVMMAANSVCYGMSLVAFYRGLPGNWVWWVPLFVRVVGQGVAVAVVAAAEAADRLAHHRRDWLHLGGIASALGLFAVDVAVNAPYLWS
jgi:hypothetical protein